MMEDESNTDSQGSSPVSRGGAGSYIEGELGAFYLLAMLSGGEARGAPGSRIERVRFQGVDEGFALDDLVIHGRSSAGETLLEVQSKRTLSFSPSDSAFKAVCRQIARVTPITSIADERHGLAVATQRTSYRISGPYQDVLEWARALDSAKSFFDRLKVKGVAGPEMRTFVTTFRANLVAAGAEDSDEAIWKLLRRFQILEFDFESSAPMARMYGLEVAKNVLAQEDLGQAKGLWSMLIEISLATAKIGGSLDRNGLRTMLLDRGLRLAGGRDFAQSRSKLADMAKHALADIGNTVAGAHLPRLAVVAAADEAREYHRFVQLRGGPGVGKSAVLRLLAERVSRESRVIVLDPTSTPDGGWNALSMALGIHGTAKDFLTDLGSSGGAVVFIDSLEMFNAPGRRRTINDLLREVSAIEGFSVIVTARTDFGQDGDDWLADDAVAALGPIKSVKVGELDDAEVAALCDQAPQLRALLAPGHPAATIARNLYRLSRLLQVADTASVRTEAALAERWWASGDESGAADVRAAQRLFAALADAALAGQSVIHSVDDTSARAGLLASLTLREPERDHLAFYHDVLRDWAVGIRLNESPHLWGTVDLTRPPPPSIARGVEFAGRFLLERKGDNGKWLALLTRLSGPQAHGAWRRHALLAILRSERCSELLEQNGATLLARGGALLTELSGAIVAIDTIPIADLIKSTTEDGTPAFPAASRSLRTAVTLAAPRLLLWCVKHAAEIPIQALRAVVKLAEVHIFLSLSAPATAVPVAKMLFDWLLQLDCRNVEVVIPNDPDADPPKSTSRQRMVEDLRSLCMLMAPQAPDSAKAYLTAVASERDTDKVKSIRPFSKALATTAPEELVALIESGLIEPAGRRHTGRRPRERTFSYGDTDYMPASPAQPPFLDLLETSKEIGLGLVRRLTSHAIAFYTADADPTDDGYTLVFDSGPRFFPWKRSYFWSRDQAPDYSVASALKALEVWGHDRLDAGDPVADVIADVLGTEGGCAAYLLVAVDLLLSNWPASREALVPFISCPALLATERSRVIHDQMGSFLDRQKEPAGRAQLGHLQVRPSRGVALEQLLPYYLGADENSHGVRSRLTVAVEETGSYEEHVGFDDPAFMGARALNLVTPANWVTVEGDLVYHPPPAEAEHLKRLDAYRERFVNSSNIEAKIQLATNDRARGSVVIAKEAVDYAQCDLPDDTDTDYLKSRSTRLVSTAMLVARDGDDILLEEHEAWVREVLARALVEDIDRAYESSKSIRFNRPALATCALIFLWRRRGQIADRDALIALAVRKDGPGPPAFAAAMDELIDADPRLAKSALRAAFATCRWRDHRWEEDAAEAEAYAREETRLAATTVAAEVAWLNGGAEPSWPSFPEEKPSIRRGLQLRISATAEAGLEDEDTKDEAATAKKHLVAHMHTHAAAAWLKVMSEAAKPAITAWLPELVPAYADWSARTNGLGYEAEIEIDQAPSEWNSEFYALATPVMLEASEDQFEQLLGMIERLPDQAFADIAEIILHAGDVWYFNDPNRVPDRAVGLRERLSKRTIQMRGWRPNLRPGDLSIDLDTGSLVAKLLMNTYKPFGATESYLVPNVFDRIDPLLSPMRLLQAGGPVAFIALCTLNTMMVAPRSRHAEFVISAVETWFGRLPTDTAMWVELGIGQRVVEWLEAAATDGSHLLQSDHPLRARVDAVLGRLVALGIPEAHRLELRVELGGPSPPFGK